MLYIIYIIKEITINIGWLYLAFKAYAFQDLEHTCGILTFCKLFYFIFSTSKTACSSWGPMCTKSLWAKCPVPSFWVQSCMFLSGWICRCTTQLQAWMCYQSWLSKSKGMCEQQVSWSLPRLMWSKCTVPGCQPCCNMHMFTRLHRKSICAVCCPRE